MEDEKAEKRVSFGLVPDDRAGCRKKLEVTGARVGLPLVRELDTTLLKIFEKKATHTP